MSDYHYEVTSLPVDETLFYRRADTIQRLRFLLRYAQLAPSTYNTQPWRFRVQPGRIWVYADPGRWLKIADADKRELHASIGCAIENLVTAADHYNYQYRIEYFPTPMQPDLVAIVWLKPGEGEEKLTDAAMLQAITRRRTRRGRYAPDPLQAAHWALLESCCTDGVRMLTSQQNPQIRNKLVELTPLAYQVLCGDRAYRREQRRRAAQGVLGSGGLWGAGKRMIFQRLFSGGGLWADRDCKRIRRAPGLMVLSCGEDSAQAHIQCGRVFQRMALIATTLGLGIQPMSQVLEIPELRAELRDALGAGSVHPVLVCRLGYTRGGARRTPRRPLDEILI